MWWTGGQVRGGRKGTRCDSMPGTEEEKDIPEEAIILKEKALSLFGSGIYWKGSTARLPVLLLLVTKRR